MKMELFMIYKFSLFLWLNLGILAQARREVLKQTMRPHFDRPSENVTVVIGSFAVLPCYVNNIGDHKVAWIKVSNNDIIAIGDYKVTNDERIKIQHSYVSDSSMSIQPVNEDDQGEYICQVNTEPPIITKINLQVLLPPKIIEEKSTIMPEPVLVGHTLKLYCHSEGIPAPQVNWYFRYLSDSPGTMQKRHHRMRHLRDSVNDQILQEGSTLIIRNISIKYSGIFECIANNSVPPAASRKIKVNVEFPPEIEMESTNVERSIGQNTRLECRIKANPLVNHYWMKDDEVIENTLINMQGHQANFIKDLSNQDKYEINIYNQNNKEYLTISSLVIKNLAKKDFGRYQCFAVNAYNTSRAELELKEVIARRKNYETTRISASRILFYNNNHQKQAVNKDYSMTTRSASHKNQSEPEIRLNKNYFNINSSPKTTTYSSLVNLFTLFLMLWKFKSLF